ncbi:MAG: hypothetical protein ABSE69_16945 [Roseiarcus sp.]
MVNVDDSFFGDDVKLSNHAEKQRGARQRHDRQRVCQFAKKPGNLLWIIDHVQDSCDSQLSRVLPIRYGIGNAQRSFVPLPLCPTILCWQTPRYGGASRRPSIRA